MAEDNPPTLNNVDFLKDFDDDEDNEDLFVSAIEPKLNQRKSSNELGEFESARPHSNSMTTMDDMLAGDEIDLCDDDEDESNSSKLNDAPLLATSHLQASVDSATTESVIPSSKPILTPTSSVTTGESLGKPVIMQSGIPETKTEHGHGVNENNKNVASDQFIKVTVGEPQKIGDGMGAYVVYKVNTNTNLPYFRKHSFAVNRRFSDFLGLREKLAEKHLHLGRIVPPAPEKSAVGMAKVKMSKEDSSSTEFIERRRAALERYLNRIAMHPVLCTDPDFREFLELDTDLPRATNTSALSGAGVKRLFSRVGDTVNKMTFKMDESDPWFEEKQNQIENLDNQLKKLHASVELLIYHRKELTQTTGSFAKSAAMLGNCEEHTALSCALSQLAETEEKIEQLYNEQTESDFYYLSELLKDYISLIGAVKEVFHQRVKVFQTWQHAQQTLTKKREQKAKFDLAGRSDKVDQAKEEVNEWEAKVQRGQEEFETISKMIRQEVERFELNRVKDFKKNIVKYMEKLLDTQQKLIKYWETFLPEAKAIV